MENLKLFRQLVDPTRHQVDPDGIDERLAFPLEYATARLERISGRIAEDVDFYLAGRVEAFRRLAEFGHAVAPEDEERAALIRAVLIGGDGSVSRGEARDLHAAQGRIKDADDVLHGIVSALDADNVIRGIRSEIALSVAEEHGKRRGLIVEVHDTEKARLDIVAEIAKHSTHIPLRLANLGPGMASQSHSVNPFARATVLSLAKPRMRREFREHLLLGDNLLVRRFWIDRITVIDKCVEKLHVLPHRLQATSQVRRIIVRQ